MLRKEENLNNPKQNQRYTRKSIEKGKRHNQVELVYLRFKFNLHLQSRYSWPNPTTVQWESLVKSSCNERAYGEENLSTNG